MTSKSFRRSRQSQKNRKSRRGGNTALANAVSASVLPVGLTLWQQHLKRKNGKKNFQKTMRNLRRFSPVN
jgi:hypothetical protein